MLGVVVRLVYSLGGDGVLVHSLGGDGGQRDGLAGDGVRRAGVDTLHGGVAAQDHVHGGGVGQRRQGRPPAATPLPHRHARPVHAPHHALPRGEEGEEGGVLVFSLLLLLQKERSETVLKYRRIDSLGFIIV